MQPAKNTLQENSASRHNNNLHFGNGLIVTLLDYIVGRASGQYLPSDPRTSKNHNSLIHDYTPRWSSKTVSQTGVGNDRPYPANNNNNNNNNNKYENSDLVHHYPTPTAISSADAKPVDKVQDRTRKYDEIMTLVAKYYTPEAVENMLAVVRGYIYLGDDRLLDEQLAFLRKLEGR